MLTLFGNPSSCAIGIEACGSAHYWARKLSALGHTVKLMAPQMVRPYVKMNQKDAADAKAIYEAVARPNMRSVPEKTAESQALLAVHRASLRVREGAHRLRPIRSVGYSLSSGSRFCKASPIAKQTPRILEDAESRRLSAIPDIGPITVSHACGLNGRRNGFRQ